MEASENIDCYGCFPGHSLEQADIEQAYVQAERTGSETWATIPKEAWLSHLWICPESVSLDAPGSEAVRTTEYQRPVSNLLRVLYGHPDAGSMWERHCHKRLLRDGFMPVTLWPPCYFHAELSLLLTVHVDDFKLAGPSANFGQGLRLVDEPGKLGLFPGCRHEQEEIIVSGKAVVTMTYSMEDHVIAFVKDCEDLSSQLLGKELILKLVATPSLENVHKSLPARAPAPYTSSTPVRPWCKVACDITVSDVAQIQNGRYARLEAIFRKRVNMTVSASSSGADVLNLVLIL